MRKWFFVILVTAIAGPCLAQSSVVDDSFFSPALNIEKAVDVYLPSGYNPEDEETRYPVIYFLHGGSSNQNGYSEVLSVADDLIGSTILPVIIVKPDGNTGPYNGWNWWSNSSTLGMIEDYIAIDLVSYIDSTYNTDARPEKRALMGHSMGATGSMIIGLHNPERFAAIVSHTGALDTKVYFDFTIPTILNEAGGSGPFNPSDGTYTTLMFADAAAWSPNPDNPPHHLDLPIDNEGNLIPTVLERWSSFNPSEIIASFTQETLPDLYLDCGEAEPRFLVPNEAFCDSMTVHDLPYRYEPYPGGHMNLLPQRYPISLAFVDSVFHPDLGRAGAAYAVESCYEPGSGDAQICVSTTNNEDHTLLLQATIYNESFTGMETIDLFDDGEHGDGEEGDGLFGGTCQIPEIEDIWWIDVWVMDQTAGTSLNQLRLGAFTTIGPLQYASHTIYPEETDPVIGETTFIRLWMENAGSTVSATDLTMKLTIEEQYGSFLLGDEQMIGDIAPGDSATHPNSFRVELSENCEPGVAVPITITVSSGGFPFWYDFFEIIPVSNNEAEAQQMLASNYAIESAWPNPFNSFTNLSVTLPAEGQYRLSIVNIQGQVVQTLLHGSKTAGRQVVPLDASELASGVYFATLKSKLHGVRTQKLVLCK
ncbi:T9SS type A sorting domain-containing protein [bacterium]|nr:T9SS type A sorting domain-containing protein [bacterium]